MLSFIRHGDMTPSSRDSYGPKGVPRRDDPTRDSSASPFALLDASNNNNSRQSQLRSGGGIGIRPGSAPARRVPMVTVGLCQAERPKSISWLKARPRDNVASLKQRWQCMLSSRPDVPPDYWQRINLHFSAAEGIVGDMLSDWDTLESAAVVEGAVLVARKRGPTSFSSSRRPPQKTRERSVGASPASAAASRALQLGDSRVETHDMTGYQQGGHQQGHPPRRPSTAPMTRTPQLTPQQQQQQPWKLGQFGQDSGGDESTWSVPAYVANAADADVTPNNVSFGTTAARSGMNVTSTPAPLPQSGGAVSDMAWRTPVGMPSLMDWSKGQQDQSATMGDHGDGGGGGSSTILTGDEMVEGWRAIDNNRTRPLRNVPLGLGDIGSTIGGVDGEGGTGGTGGAGSTTQHHDIEREMWRRLEADRSRAATDINRSIDGGGLEDEEVDEDKIERFRQHRNRELGKTGEFIR